MYFTGSGLRGSCWWRATAEQLKSSEEKKVLTKVTKAKGNVKVKLSFRCLWSPGHDYFLSDFCHRVRNKIILSLSFIEYHCNCRQAWMNQAFTSENHGQISSHGFVQCNCQQKEKILYVMHLCQCFFSNMQVGY